MKILRPLPPQHFLLATDPLCVLRLEKVLYGGDGSAADVFFPSKNFQPLRVLEDLGVSW